MKVYILQYAEQDDTSIIKVAISKEILVKWLCDKYKSVRPGAYLYTAYTETKIDCYEINEYEVDEE